MKHFLGAALLALSMMACRSECENALRERVGLELPKDAEFAKCEYHNVTALKNSFRIEAEFESRASFADLSQQWDLQETGLDAFHWLLLSQLVGLPPGQRGDRPDAVKDSALRIRSHQAVALRQLGASRYRLNIEKTPDAKDTARRPVGGRASTRP